MTGGWPVEQAVGSAATFHSRPLGPEMGRSVHVWQVERPALVLGSTQRDDVVDHAACEAAGVEVVRRRSGGGAVLLGGADTVWVDVELPRADALWLDDVGQAAWWLGDAWADALGALGVEGGRVHRGGLVVTEWSRLVCFAGLGPGEVTSAGRKVVGISQRRTRDGVRFQCAVALRWEIGRLAGLLALDAAQRARLVADLETSVAPVPQPAERVVAELLRALTSLT